MGVTVMAMTLVESSTRLRARSLRKNATEGEKRLWTELREWRKRYGVPVRRQVPFGPYVADFAIYFKHLIIELDGEFHALEVRARRDAHRDSWLPEQGYRVLRINTGELAGNFDGCIETLLREVGVTS